MISHFFPKKGLFSGGAVKWVALTTLATETSYMCFTSFESIRKHQLDALLIKCELTSRAFKQIVSFPHKPWCFQQLWRWYVMVAPETLNLLPAEFFSDNEKYICILYRFWILKVRTDLKSFITEVNDLIVNGMVLHVDLRSLLLTWFNFSSNKDK